MLVSAKYISVWFSLLLLVAACLVLTTPAGAQSSATLQGTITDSTGAVIPNGKVVIRNKGTGLERVVQTDEAGTYLAASLAPGIYTVEIQAPGMAKMVANDVVLQVSQTVVQNFSLKVAATTETIEITAAAPVIESGTTSVGAVIDSKT